MAVRQTCCAYCGFDIENFSPYRRGEWLDRGGASHCTDGLEHAPSYSAARDRALIQVASFVVRLTEGQYDRSAIAALNREQARRYRRYRERRLDYEPSSTP